MKTLTTLALGACMALTFAGASFAQSSNMSASDKAMMDKCKAMSESAMKADKDCMAMMKKDGMSSPSNMNANPTPKSK